MLMSTALDLVPALFYGLIFDVHAKRNVAIKILFDEMKYE